jgi:hypothetical protein
MIKARVLPSVRLLAFAMVFIAVEILAQANTCSSFVVDQITHESFRVGWHNDEATGLSQIQYGSTSSYGSIEGDSQGAALFAGGTRYQTVTGLASNTLYHFAAQSNNGTALCPAVDQTVTTAAAVTHPVLPTGPQTYSVSAPTAATGRVIMVSPATCAGIPSWQTLYGNGSATCVNVASLQAALTTGSAANATYGDVLILQAGVVNAFASSALATHPMLPGSIPS